MVSEEQRKPRGWLLRTTLPHLAFFPRCGGLPAGQRFRKSILFVCSCKLTDFVTSSMHACLGTPKHPPKPTAQTSVLAWSGMTVEYDCSDFNELTGFLRWRGTVLPAVLCRPAIWVLLLIHCVLLYMRMRLDLDLGMIVKSDPPDDISKVSTTHSHTCTIGINAYICVYMYMCVYVCIYACMYVGMYV